MKNMIKEEVKERMVKGLNEQILLDDKKDIMLNKLIKLGYNVYDFDYDEISNTIYETNSKSTKYLNKANECLKRVMELNKTNSTNEEILKLLSKCNTYCDLVDISNKNNSVLIDYVEKNGHKFDNCAIVESEKYFGLFSYVIFDKDFNIIDVVDI